ncbi:disulfide bond formation protein B [Ramlibacter albus]|uniref:Disulfide bond formation protein B n=1 Tax=Ramlibacter albus TaxID=2079448 RepID=A0A923M847_9BURK|nr:disulfide bond formation protein B [Ramlibacter albus]MBC5764297.1 disulfide bond formation protein B [Ramlibacter albus]
MILEWFERAPRRVLAATSAACIAMLAFGVYLQQVVGLDPCPMCIVQRYAFILVALVAGIGACFKGRGAHVTTGVLMVLFSGFGAFVAARQSFLQWYPPEVVSCGRDFYGMIENFPLRRAIPMIFRGTGDCTKVDWTFLGGSIANWAFLVFCATAVVGVLIVVKRWGARAPALATAS